MIHLDEEALLDAYYGAASAQTEEHLSCCSQCRDDLDRLRDVLDSIRLAPRPEPLPDFDQRLWNSLRPHIQLPGHSRRRWLPPALVLAFCSCLALLIFTRPSHLEQHERPRYTPASVRNAALSRHLERAQILITQVLHGSTDSEDFLMEQQRARQLLMENRTLRVQLATAHAQLEQKVLDGVSLLLERIADAPDRLSPSDIAQLRTQVEDDALLFKVRLTRASLERSY